MKQVIIIGAGAAGLMCAAAAAEKGLRVLVLEKNEKAGKKIYITGKGRCNLTNDCETSAFFEHVVHNPKFLYSAVYGFDQTQTKAFFKEQGCPLKTERGQRVFPVSDHASDVTKALTGYLKKHAVQIRYHAQVSDLLLEDGAVGGVILSNGEKLRADYVVICTGGLSYPSTGSTGDGYRLAVQAGHSIQKTAPSLVPFTVEDMRWCTLQGLALKNVAVRILPRDAQIQEVQAEDTKIRETQGEEGKRKEALQTAFIDPAETVIPEQGKSKKAKCCNGKASKKKYKPVYEGFGEMLFTHFGISGPLLLTASSYCDFDKFPQGFVMEMDLKPAITEEELTERLKREFAAAPQKQFGNAIGSLFPSRLAEVMASLSDIDKERMAGRISEKEITEFVRLVKKVPIVLTGTRDYPEAIVTRGGVSVKEVNPSTMESKLVKGLYFAGEVLDVDAVTGGYNLQIAWSTGRLAGMSIKEDAAANSSHNDKLHPVV